MQNVPRTYVETLPPRPPPANHKPQTREPWPKLADFADFDTTISISFLGQISYCLRRGNPQRVSVAVTHRVFFASAAWGCSFLLGDFLASVKLADFVSLVEVKDELWGLPMMRTRQPNWPNQSRMIFRADRDLRVAGSRRNEPMATLTRTIR